MYFLFQYRISFKITIGVTGYMNRLNYRVFRKNLQYESLNKRFRNVQYLVKLAYFLGFYVCMDELITLSK